MWKLGLGSTSGRLDLPASRPSIPSCTAFWVGGDHPWHLILCFTHFSQTPRGSRRDPGRIQWISANMASPAGSSETQKQKRSAVARAQGNFSGGNNPERPRARRERCPSRGWKAPAALFSPCKVKTRLLKTKNGIFLEVLSAGEGLSWRSLPTAPPWNSSSQPRFSLGKGR